ncbi:uncharacterized protein A1O9_06011 [Exophiala aquamarina CBS 119918]|uniref:Uncharacterized protein n=1 Tax=Exophiala aquamarina CBS 119918 TaxID=1182545 RepID=A0A072PFN2_9EURO|nr:uncharacterized protein A1O9_06011 [Exophiala aquamarina CBS 119918]KEF58088.1 hypothetical protein A1O9_06011 [Exophiala aquamarina CBS 119918]
MASLLSQMIEESNVYKKYSASRGNGLFASQDLQVKSQVIFVARPLLMVLDTAQLKSHCDYCLKPPSEHSPWADSGENNTLKRCTGCSVLRFCDRQCQKHAWAQYHKLECKVYAAQPRALPTLNRAILRLLKQHDAGILPVGEWEALHSLQDHYEGLLQVGGKNWQDLLLVAKKLQQDSGGKRRLETILRLVCLVVVNSFTLTNPTFDPIGLALHPRSALFNHSCEPNALVRFDVAPKSEAGKFPPSGSISVYTLRPVSKDEELTISYIDTTSPLVKRQQELKERYFFDCACKLCSQGTSHVLDGLRLDGDSSAYQRQEESKKLMNAQTSAEQYLEWVKATPGLEHQQVAEIRDAMSKLAATHNWELHRYPWPQLRKLLFLGLLGLEEFDAAFLQCAILLQKVYPVIFTQRHHPVRLVEMWTLFRMCHALLVTQTSPEGYSEPLVTLGCAALHELNSLLDIGGRVEGQFEHLVVKALHAVQSEPFIWGKYEERVSNSASAWAWLDQKIHDYLVKEEGIQVEELGHHN